jgi:hypothetical protein
MIFTALLVARKRVLIERYFPAVARGNLSEYYEYWNFLTGCAVQIGARAERKEKELLQGLYSSLGDSTHAKRTMRLFCSKPTRPLNEVADIFLGGKRTRETGIDKLIKDRWVACKQGSTGILHAPAISQWRAEITRSFEE